MAPERLSPFLAARSTVFTSSSESVTDVFILRPSALRWLAVSRCFPCSGFSIVTLRSRPGRSNATKEPRAFSIPRASAS